MSAIICGSLAYDSIMVFEGRFGDEILPDKTHQLSVSFLVPEMRKEFGGCAANIAYALKQLGGQGKAMGTVGEDFGPYAQRFDDLGLDASLIKTVPGTFTAQAFITTDLDDNQIIAFHPGAMNHSHEQQVPADGSLGIVAPDGRDGMIQHAQQFADAGTPFLFDPGQGLPMFGGDELKQFIALATYVAVNDYEAAMIADRTGWTLEQIAEHVDALIVTRGAKGSEIYAGGEKLEIAAAKPDAIVDPTGCGDAYRGGLLYGLEKGYDWQTTGQIASVMGAIKIAVRGPQNYQIDAADFAGRYQDAFGADFPG